VLAGCKGPSAPEESEQGQREEESHRSFASPEAAIEALVVAWRRTMWLRFGPGGEPLVRWSDPVAEKQDRAEFLEMCRAKHQLVDEAERRKVLEVGTNDSTLPAPLVCFRRARRKHHGPLRGHMVRGDDPRWRVT
jgi:hypothetical protein